MVVCLTVFEDFDVALDAVCDILALILLPRGDWTAKGTVTKEHAVHSDEWVPPCG